MRAAIISSILLLIVVLLSLDGVTCNTFHVWNGRLAYYNGDREMNFNDTKELCTSLGGVLPSVHSTNDTQFLTRLVGGSARVWLGGIKNGSDYQWMDGSPFDYHPWLTPDEPSCTGSCCAVGFTTVISNGFVAKECQIHRRMICVVRGINTNMEHQIIPHEINATLERHEQAIQTLTEINFELMNSSMNALKEQFDEITRLGADSQINLDQLNASVRALSDRLTAFHNTYDQKVSNMGINLVKLQSQLEDMNRTVSMKTKQAATAMSQVQTQESQSRDQVDELGKETDRLAGRINFCFYTLILLAAGLLSRSGYKLYQWARPNIPYKRQQEQVMRSSLTEDADRL